MATAGYSGTPLLIKLGIKSSMKLLLVNKPTEYFKWVDANLNSLLCKKNEIPDFIHLFSRYIKDFEIEMKKIKLIAKKNKNIIIWVSWYKKISKIETDITEDVIRDYALQNDLVDVKVCAITEQWSGLKLVVPLSKR